WPTAPFSRARAAQIPPAIQSLPTNAALQRASCGRPFPKISFGNALVPFDSVSIASAMSAGREATRWARAKAGAVLDCATDERVSAFLLCLRHTLKRWTGPRQQELSVIPRLASSKLVGRDNRR